jgi:NifU-like protein involved in Fe-S cluster formation
MAPGVNAPLYTMEILRLAASLQGPRDLVRVDGSAELRSPTCGSRISTGVQLNDEGRVQALSQRVEACAFGQASAALVEANALGCSPAELSAAFDDLSRWLAGEQEQVEAWPGSMALAPARPKRARHGAILLPLRALIAAIEASA